MSLIKLRLANKPDLLVNRSFRCEPVAADNMRSWDRSKPEERLEPRSEPLQKSQVSRTVRGVKSARNADSTPPSRPMLSTATCS